MTIQTSSISITTQDIRVCEDFYKDLFDAKVIFDCGWYLLMSLPSTQSPAPEIGWMEPQEGQAPYSAGLVINVQVDDVDTLHQSWQGKQLTEVMPLEDHPWGDRGFAVLDPIGVTVYCFHNIEATDEFKAYYR